MKVLTAADLRCKKTGKRSFVNEEQAEAEMELAWTDPKWKKRSHHDGMPVRSYLCECGWYHLTSRGLA